MSTRDRTLHPAVLTTTLLLVVLGAATATTWHVELPAWTFGGTPPENELATTEPAPPPPPPEPAEPPDSTTLATVLLVLAALAVAALLWYVARKIVTAVRAVPDQTVAPDELDTGEGLTTEHRATLPVPELADAVTRALAHLDHARTPTDGVVAAWIALEDAAAEHGTHRDPAQTTTEFTHDILTTTPAPPTHLDTLRRLYQQARFAHQRVDDDDVDHARTALVAIARSLDDAPPPDRAP
ncbi:DUF4129 domain-containing protein [Isoptericola jiangsuensis]|uniref:DUF4129 domain-containing protein n=1 Tax=Isoptericola jiangsuensis TaxID=548579 RepID=UPI003AAE1715